MSKFANACIMSYEQWAATIPEDLPEPKYSKKHIRRMNALMDKMRGNVYHHFTTRAIKIMLVAAVLFALLLSAFVIPSSREFIIDKFDIASRYQLTTENNNSVTGEISVGYIPDGFKLNNKDTSVKHILYSYISNIGQDFTIQKYSSSVEVDFDTENFDFENIISNNRSYTYYSSLSGNNGIMWNQNDYIYQIIGPFSKDELLKIAESVK